MFEVCHQRQKRNPEVKKPAFRSTSNTGAKTRLPARAPAAITARTTTMASKAFKDIWIRPEVRRDAARTGSAQSFPPLHSYFSFTDWGTLEMAVGTVLGAGPRGERNRDSRGDTSAADPFPRAT